MTNVDPELQWVEDYIKALTWAEDADKGIQLYVAGNIRGFFYAYRERVQAQTHELLTTISHQAAEIARLTKPVEQTLTAADVREFGRLACIARRAAGKLKAEMIRSGNQLTGAAELDWLVEAKDAFQAMNVRCHELAGLRTTTKPVEGSVVEELEIHLAWLKHRNAGSEHFTTADDARSILAHLTAQGFRKMPGREWLARWFGDNRPAIVEYKTGYEFADALYQALEGGT